MKIAWINIEGFEQKVGPGATSGLLTLEGEVRQWLTPLMINQTVAETVTDAVVQTWVYDHKIAAAELKAILACDRIFVAGYSWHFSEAFTDLCSQLDAAGRQVDCYYAIDPVPHGSWLWIPGLLWEAAVPSKTALILPKNIVRALLWRTVNWQWFLPWGRDIVPAAGAKTIVVSRTIFGSPANLQKYLGAAASEVRHVARKVAKAFMGKRYRDAASTDRRIEDATVTHCFISGQPQYHAIDSDYRVHNAILADVQQLVAQ